MTILFNLHHPDPVSELTKKGVDAHWHEEGCIDLKQLKQAFAKVLGPALENMRKIEAAPKTSPDYAIILYDESDNFPAVF